MCFRLISMRMHHCGYHLAPVMYLRTASVGEWKSIIRYHPIFSKTHSDHNDDPCRLNDLDLYPTTFSTPWSESQPFSFKVYHTRPMSVCHALIGIWQAAKRSFYSPSSCLPKSTSTLCMPDDLEYTYIIFKLIYSSLIIHDYVSESRHALLRYKEMYCATYCKPGNLLTLLPCIKDGVSVRTSSY